MIGRKPTSVAIIGAGTMGAGIAITTLCAGLPTVLIDRAPDSLAQATARLEAYLARAVAKGRMNEADAQAARGRLVTSDSLAAAAQADLVIEAVFEKLEVKTAPPRPCARWSRLGSRGRLSVPPMDCRRMF